MTDRQKILILAGKANVDVRTARAWWWSTRPVRAAQSDVLERAARKSGFVRPKPELRGDAA